MADFKPRKSISFTAVVDRIEDQYAVLELAEKKQIQIPLAYIPDNTEEGDVMQITCTRAPDERIARAQTAKDLLNGILGLHGEQN